MVMARLWAGFFALCPLAAAVQPTAKTGPDIDYMIVVTGGELLAGEYADGHTHFLTRTLRPMGLHCVGSMTVDDRREDMTTALRFASEKAPLVIVTGGLGPTDNDVTRETLEAFTGIALRENPDVLGAMERRFNTPRDELRANLRKQARVPTAGTYLKNANGTAVGLVFEMKGRTVVALPGPPRELEPMVRDELVPYLARRFGTHPPGCSLTVRFVGMGQSAIDQALDERVTLPPGVILGSRFEGARVDFTFAMPHDTPEERAQLEVLKEKIAQQLGENIYAFGDASLEEVVLKGLEARGLTLAIAEIGSGGALATGLNGAPRASAVILGAFSAPTTERMRPLLGLSNADWPGDASGEEGARILAEALARKTGAGWAVAVGTLANEPAGGRAVPVALRFPDGRMAMERIGFRGTGESARASLVTQLLDLLRRRLR